MEDQKSYICHVCSNTFKDIVDFKIHKHNIGDNWFPMYEVYRKEQDANANINQSIGKNQRRRSLSDIGKTFFCFGKNNCIGENYSYGEPGGKPDIINHRPDGGNDKGGANIGGENHDSGFGNSGDGENSGDRGFAPGGGDANGGRNNPGGSRQL